jgi:hypothetical protein
LFARFGGDRGFVVAAHDCGLLFVSLSFAF